MGVSERNARALMQTIDLQRKRIDAQDVVIENLENRLRTLDELVQQVIQGYQTQLAQLRGNGPTER